MANRMAAAAHTLLAAVIMSPPPFLLWAFLSLLTFFVQGELAVGPDRAFPDGSVLFAVVFVIGVYLLGPAWVLRGPRWRWQIPFPTSQRHWTTRLPAPALTPRELVTRNLLGFAAPMLLSAALVRALALQPPKGVGPGADAGGGETAGVETVLTVLLFCAIGAVLVHQVRLTYKAGELERVFVGLALVGVSVAGVSLAISARYHLQFRAYALCTTLIPLVAHDRHISSVLQGILIGLAMEDIGRNGPRSLWSYSPSVHY